MYSILGRWPLCLLYVYVECNCRTNVAWQIPGPLTDEMELERKAKVAEKKKLQRKAKKERVKVCSVI